MLSNSVMRAATTGMAALAFKHVVGNPPAAAQRIAVQNPVGPRQLSSSVKESKQAPANPSAMEPREHYAEAWKLALREKDLQVCFAKDDGVKSFVITSVFTRCERYWCTYRPSDHERARLLQPKDQAPFADREALLDRLGVPCSVVEVLDRPIKAVNGYRLPHQHPDPEPERND